MRFRLLLANVRSLIGSTSERRYSLPFNAAEFDPFSLYTTRNVLDALSIGLSIATRGSETFLDLPRTET